MAHAAKSREVARRLYVYDRFTVAGISQRLKISVPTVGNWKRRAKLAGDDWDRARLAASVAGDGAAEVAQRFMVDFMNLLQATVDDVKAHPDMSPQGKVDALARLAHAYNQAMAGVKRSIPQLSELAVALEVMQELAKFVQQKYPASAAALVEVLEPFGAFIAKKYG